MNGFEKKTLAKQDRLITDNAIRHNAIRENTHTLRFITLILIVWFIMWCYTG